MDYIPHTEKEVQEMLKEIGLERISQLFEHVPKKLEKTPEILGNPKSSLDIENYFSQIASENRILSCFAGAGTYNHYIPPAVKELSSRAEFYTSYTPYQAEISQGILEAFFEFQTYICRLTGMDSANASMYCGGSSLAEAALLAAREKKNNRILIKTPLYPDYERILRTYGWAGGGLEIEYGEGKGEYAAIIAQNPDFLGRARDLREFKEEAQKSNGLFISVIGDPTSLAILEPPGKQGADIVVGDGQAFGNPMGFGGPHVGFFAVKEALIKKMPGRIVGKTTDSNGKEGYILTLQAREQHIRRERATSNICSNQALCALNSTIYLSLMGEEGLRNVAKVSYARSHYLAKKLQKIGFELENPEFYNEFSLTLSEKINSARKKMLKNGILFGIDSDKDLIVCATEMNSKEEIDKVISILEGCA